jgi:hypothetical protein
VDPLTSSVDDALEFPSSSFCSFQVRPKLTQAHSCFIRWTDCDGGPRQGRGTTWISRSTDCQEPTRNHRCFFPAISAATIPGLKGSSSQTSHPTTSSSRTSIRKQRISESQCLGNFLLKLPMALGSPPPKMRNLTE